MVVSLVGWLVVWLVGLFVGLFESWLVGCFDVCLYGCLGGWLDGWLVCWLVRWMFDRWVGWLVGRCGRLLVDNLVCVLVVWFLVCFGWLVDWLFG